MVERMLGTPKRPPVVQVAVDVPPAQEHSRSTPSGSVLLTQRTLQRRMRNAPHGSYE